MSDIRVDFDTLANAQVRLSAIIGDLRETGHDSSTSLEIDHGGLRSAVGDFRNAWRVRRERLVEELEFLAESVRAIHDTFQELDADLAKRAEKIPFQAPALQLAPGAVAPVDLVGTPASGTSGAFMTATPEPSAP